MKIKNILKNRKIFVKVFITLLFLICSILYVNKKELRLDVQLLVRIKVPHKDTYKLFINDKPEKMEVFPSEGFQWISFKVPKDEIKQIRLNFGKEKGIAIIESIKLKTILNKYIWKDRALKRIFNYKHHIEKTYLKDNNFYIKIAGNDPFMVMDKKFYEIIEKVKRKKTFFYCLSIILSLILFYLIYFINIKNLRFFATRKIISNMILVFLVFIYFPIVNDVLNVTKKFHLQEKRAQVKKPDLRFDALYEFLAKYRRYYKDNFSLRNMLIYLNNLYKIKLYNFSPVSKTIIGKNGWLFMAKESEDVNEVDYFRSIKLFSEEELKHWRNALEQRRDWLVSRGILYFFIIVPNKSTIYSEFMPDFIHPVRNQSRLDQLLNYLKKNSDFQIIDLRKVLINAKKDCEVYYKTDSHWNEYGAYIAYREIMRYIGKYFENIKPMHVSNFKIETKNRFGGDLAIALSLQNTIYRENFIEFRSKIPLKARGKRLRNISKGVCQTCSVCKTPGLPNAVIVHDSFIHELRPFISEHFSRILYIWDWWNMNFYPDIIKREKPKIVIEEMAERFLMNKKLNNPDEVLNFKKK
jgi:hypothetical protein